jgi:hypothetical protein
MRAERRLGASAVSTLGSRHRAGLPLPKTRQELILVLQRDGAGMLAFSGMVRKEALARQSVRDPCFMPISAISEMNARDKYAVEFKLSKPSPAAS